MSKNKIAEFKFEPLRKTTAVRRGKYLTLDKQGRVMLSQEFRHDIAPVEAAKEIPFNIYMFLEKSHKIIGVLRQDKEPRATTGDFFRVDKRGYARGKDIAEAFALDLKSGPYRFEHIGKIDDQGHYYDGFRLVQNAE